MRTVIPLLLAVVSGCTTPTVQTGDGSLPDRAASAVPDMGSTVLPDGNAGTPDGPSPDLTPAQPLPETEFLDGTQSLGTPVIDASPDETGNLWVAAPDALYIRRAGETDFRRYTNADGLHIYTYITAVAGGGVNEGWLGLEGHDSNDPSLDPPDLRREGHAEHVHLHADGTIDSLHYEELHTDVDVNYWENPSARRLLYVHDGVAAGHLFMGLNHGVDHVLNDTWGDHVHVEVYYQPENSGTYGQWYGLAMDTTIPGAIWTCGRNACGLQEWNPSPRAWVKGRYTYAFTVFTGDHGLDVPHGYTEDFVGTAVTADGTAYFLSRTMGLASWQPHGNDYQHIQTVAVPIPGTPVDIAADPDGTLWIAGDGGVVRYDPATGAADAFALPSGDVRRIYVDTRSSPRTLYFSTGGGLAIYRGK